jgi:LmbE family N-acetylglucosaminyl deacetylase
MGGTLAKLSDLGQRILLVDLTDGEPTEFVAPGVRALRLSRPHGSLARTAASSACAIASSRTIPKRVWSLRD